MTAYLVLIRESVSDETQFEEKYRKLVPPTFVGFDKHALAQSRGHAFDVLEGKEVQGISIVTFPTIDEAKRWYNSPSYQEAVRGRAGLADCRIIVVEALPEN